MVITSAVVFDVQLMKASKLLRASSTTIHISAISRPIASFDIIQLNQHWFVLASP